jgi:hypothetical protein
MPLPDIGVSLSLNEIHIEAGGTSGTTASINDADIRGLINKTANTPMSFSEWYGAANGPQVKYFATATKGGTNPDYTMTANTSVSTGDLVMLIWISGYGLQGDTAWNVRVGTGSNNFTSLSAGFNAWFAANGYLKCYMNASTAQNSGSSVTFSASWSDTNSGTGLKGVILVIGNATSLSEREVSTGPNNPNRMQVTSSPALAVSFTGTTSNQTPTGFINTASPSILNSSLSLYNSSNSITNYDLHVATHFATAGDVSNGYFNIYADYNIGENAPQADGVVIF